MNFRRLNPILYYCSPEQELILEVGDTALPCRFFLLLMVKSLRVDTKFKEIQLLEELDCELPTVGFSCSGDTVYPAALVRRQKLRHGCIHVSPHPVHTILDTGRSLEAVPSQ